MTLARGVGVLALVVLGCGYHDTPVATYREELPDGPVAGSVGTAGSGGGTAGSGGSAGDVAGNGAGGSDPVGAAGEAGAAPLCLQTYTVVAEGLTSRYKEVTAGQPWAAAERDCEAEGGHLIVIDDEAENDWMKAFAEKSMTDSGSSNKLSWLGAGDHAVEGQFVWVTGAALGLMPWAADEPNSLDGYEDCVEIRSTGQWNDDRCNAKLSYVCECDAAPSVGNWCDTDTTTTCGDCSTSCAAEQECSRQVCQ